MKAALPLLPACLLATTGCVTTSPFGLAAPAPAENVAPAPQAATPAAAPQPAPAGARPPPPAASNLPATAAARPEPDAVIKLNPGDEPLSREMEIHLSAIAARARADDRILLRLESYVPGGGSPSLNLLRAEQSLHLVRKRLVELDVSPRRILLAPFGGEYVTARDERRQWVEIYLIRPRL